ncbi:ligase-associated DNA damage response endonuclease PdeM [Roseivirga sp. UBA838]|uniref:ligase-associated DNA damage response endonuclease PdeM n=1 Tax=Roseivirga sp. UBA838 TaxID=1947393 RepID=UPI00257BE972|nr:ligase-associated DNA damage response endonuclease PdeM [Roseivirga sp. UBA838]|tara:strand:+ start:18806 stop:19435 length:630 start_codon:yes stop_codon:yes gene_type:complete
MVHELLGQRLVLIPEKGIFWADKKYLILADLHLGKAGHFRKSGIPVSDLIHTRDIHLLDQLIARFAPEQVIFLGDLFHSDHNQGWEVFRHWMKSKAPLQFSLVLGNHDVLDARNYQIPNLQVSETLCIPPFHLSHIPEETELYNLAGHIHPAVKLYGKGRQSLRLPCFYFGKRNGLLPAFGHFTGTAKINIKKDDAVYAIADKQVVRVN